MSTDAIYQRKLLQRQMHPASKTQRLWIVPDNGVYTTINVRGEATPEGSIAFNPNFVYGTADTPVVQPDPNSDQWWRYEDVGYKTLSGPSSGGGNPHYEMINVGPMQSDGSEWGYVPEQATPAYNYFPAQFYPSSNAYNYPAAPSSPAVAKEGYIFSNGQGQGAVRLDGTVGSDHATNEFGPGVNWGVDYNY
ncbi:hypothetical protein GUITHDRAFT_118106 [Guillardia theta CCMP2712]|uniref:Uncharacterized protein n=1 Tax=Guillardia theta (strain CCMP2712) TaxID=905079 RepID=L1IHJ2_GUITC|nr:hypothetical protein GUITHDRAFT_118106 [Guillardia theta CCMP2712]EKX35721.1 hypothetical protein GUITHDRAFT_118106 [Guillardia theta CCMP2712]|eukprot:XP_005822701.1 hypothetical protein GUITHDRAFT_118106 [Guillardia theta CCMP2712]